MKRRPLALVLLSVALAACGGDPIRGGKTGESRVARQGRDVATFVPTKCVDARGAPSPVVERSRLTLVQRRDEKLVLVEETPGFDALLVDNSFEDGGGRVFQVITESNDGVPLLREFRLAKSGAGKLAVARDWSSTSLRGGGFRASYRQAILSCALTAPGESAAGVPVPKTADGASLAAADASTAAPLAIDAGAEE